MFDPFAFLKHGVKVKHGENGVRVEPELAAKKQSEDNVLYAVFVCFVYGAGSWHRFCDAIIKK